MKFYTRRVYVIALPVDRIAVAGICAASRVIGWKGI